MVVLCGQNDYVIRRAYRRAQPVVGVPRIDQTLRIISALRLRTAGLLKRESFRLVLISSLVGRPTQSLFSTRENVRRGSRLEC